MKKELLLFCLLLATVTLSAQQPVTWSQIKTTTDNHHRTTHYYEGKAMSGHFRIKKGLDELDVTFVQGLMDGAYLRLRDGVVREEGRYNAGIRDGLFVEYYQDGKTHRKDTPIKSGKIQGKVITYFRNGKVDTETEYKNGLKHGSYIRYTEQGNICAKGIYTDGEKEGQWMEVTDAGKGYVLKSIKSFRKGELDGEIIEEITKDGEPYLTTKGHYSKGKKTGAWSRKDFTNGKQDDWVEE